MPTQNPPMGTPSHANNGRARGADSRGRSEAIEVIVEAAERPGYAFCALPPHFFDRGLAAKTERRASISLESWRSNSKGR
jgi:hypothetical protein